MPGTRTARPMEFVMKARDSRHAAEIPSALNGGKMVKGKHMPLTTFTSGQRSWLSLSSWHSLLNLSPLGILKSSPEYHFNSIPHYVARQPLRKSPSKKPPMSSRLIPTFFKQGMMAYQSNNNAFHAM
ncbi:hypothetical protein AMTR_s00023p00145730 [Amborella trichopoda]|uniref:Uncharacterized protein n=1 Tax=Amborella trichopoda TaxID=13333 RepID=W1NJH3_AMBTC|nr:hypothetical protein AMTR_s00023p00145730 [Amborella trichopoda]